MILVSKPSLVMTKLKVCCFFNSQKYLKCDVYCRKASEIHRLAETKISTSHQQLGMTATGLSVISLELSANMKGINVDRVSMYVVSVSYLHSHRSTLDIPALPSQWHHGTPEDSPDGTVCKVVSPFPREITWGPGLDQQDRLRLPRDQYYFIRK